MTIRARATGLTRDAEPIFEVTEDRRLEEFGFTVVELSELKAAESRVLDVVAAMKALARAAGSEAIQRAILEVGQCVNEEAAQEVVDRVAAQKAVYTEALAAIAALP